MSGAGGNFTVSAVVPTYNRLAHVPRALRSILSQSVPVDEIIVVDDGSTDGTAAVLRTEFGSAVNVIEQANTGVSGARARGVEAAKGEWIAFLDSDDEWTPDRNRLLLEAARAANPAVPWVFGDTLRVDDSGKAQSLYREYGLSITGLTVYTDPMPVQFPFQFSLLQSSLIRREAIIEVGGFRQGLRHSEDLLVGWQIAATNSMAAIPQAVTRLNRTSDLAASSLDLYGRVTPDYHRARVIGYEALLRGGRPGPWARLHSDSVRRWCLRLSENGAHGLRRAALAQFRHGVSFPAVLFMAAALAGRPGLNAWRWASGRRGAVSGARPVPSSAVPVGSAPL